MTNIGNDRGKENSNTPHRTGLKACLVWSEVMATTKHCSRPEESRVSEHDCTQCLIPGSMASSEESFEICMNWLQLCSYGWRQCQLCPYRLHRKHRSTKYRDEGIFTWMTTQKRLTSYNISGILTASSSTATTTSTSASGPSLIRAISGHMTWLVTVVTYSLRHDEITSTIKPIKETRT